MRMALKDEQTGKNKHFINSLEFAGKESKQFFEKNVICANMWRLVSRPLCLVSCFP